jgi:hypothetical protein
VDGFRAAMKPLDIALIGQSLQVASGGSGTDGKLFANLFNRHPLVLLHKF